MNAIARPGLMIIGFLFASALMIALGTLQAHMFLPAMANVQGNSITGLASVIVFIMIFFLMNVTLISASFNLVYVITDEVLGFIGARMDSKLGNTAWLSEVFVEGYLNSAARFEIMRHSVKPDELQARYRKKLRDMVRAVVLDGDTRIPTEVLAEDHGAFQALVSKELDLLRLNNEGTLAQLQLQAGDVQDWLRSEGGGAAPRERLS